MNDSAATLNATAIRRSLDRVASWVEGHAYRGYEPFDGLSSPLHRLTFGNLFLQRCLQQLIRQCPFNLRPLLGVTRKDSTKGRGYFAWGYLLLHRATGETDLVRKAVDCLEWLDRHKVPRFAHHSWSNHFDFASRGGHYTSNDPIIVWTALIGHAYLEAFEITHEPRFLAIAESACRWILQLPREKTDRGTCISYLAHEQCSIHNANMLGAGLLARTSAHNGDPEFRQVAREAMVYSCTRQLPNGAWWYAEPEDHQWIDNFHTGYNLDSLHTYIRATGDEEFRPNLERGFDYFKATFFEPSGRPKYYHSRTYPVDIQCAAQAIDTLALFADEDPEALALARKVAHWTITHMQDRRGYFYYRQYPLLKAKTPMLHWGQATMYKALVQLYVRLVAAEQPAAAVAAAR